MIFLDESAKGTICIVGYFLVLNTIELSDGLAL